VNFLEQLVAEWYQYKGYLVRTNVRFGRNARGRGGHVGEMDVIAFDPKEKGFIHIETSTDADTWSKRKRKFEKKFSDARRYYMEEFSFKEMGMKPKQIAIVGFNLNPRQEYTLWKSSAPGQSQWGDIEIDVIHIPRFFKQINAELKNRNPQNEAVPETYPLLRAIQYSVFYAEHN